EVVEPLGHGMLHVLLVPHDLQESGDRAVARQKTEPPAGRDHTGKAGDGAPKVAHVLPHDHRTHDVTRPFEPVTAHAPAAAAPGVGHPPAAGPAEQAAEVFEPHRVQLVQAGERPRVAPPRGGDPVYQALVLLGLRETAGAGELVGHEKGIYGGNEEDGGGWWRISGGWWRWLPSE